MASNEAVMTISVRDLDEVKSEIATLRRQLDEQIRDKHRILGEYEDKVHRLTRRVDVGRQMATTIYNCNGAPEQWERGKRVLVELLVEWDASSK